jgi:hypothetical protein
MNRLARALILFLVFAALPLRGYAGVVMALCDAHHGGGAAQAGQDGHHGAGHGSHDHGTLAAGAHGDAQDEGSDAFATVCSLCSACSLGATLAPDSLRQLGVPPAGAARVPFLHRRVASHTPDNPDRPPLALPLQS